MSKKRTEYLVVDTSAFIQAAPLQDIADNILTTQEVIDEVTSNRQLKKLLVLPYDLVVKDVFPEYVKIISEFAKKTGDYMSLSATDIKVMALTYQLEKEKVGVQHLKTEPVMQKTMKITGLLKKIDDATKQNESSVTNTHKKPEDQSTDSDVKLEDCSQLEEEEKVIKIVKETVEQMNLLNLKTVTDNGVGEEKIDNSEELLVQADSSDESDESSDEDSDSDGGDWITPGNLQEKKKEMDKGEYFEDKHVTVACITTDFAMQNVLKQIGLNVAALDGRLIKQVRTFIFRCTTCFKTTSIMTKVFCPKCGHATLKRVAVSVDEHGNQQIHINARKPLTARGKKFSLPTPRGGQHFQYPILTEDQHIKNRKTTRLARAKNNPLDPDYVAGYSPFVMRDVNSKSAVLGIRQKQDIKQAMRQGDNRRKKK